MKKFISLIMLFMLLVNSSIFAFALPGLISAEEDFFEIVPDRRDLPGISEVKKLYTGMPLTEALDIMGNPQGTYSGINCLIFNLKNGQSLNLYFNADENNIKYVWDIKVIGWPYKLIIFIFLAAIVIFASIIIKIYKNKAKKAKFPDDANK